MSPHESLKCFRSSFQLKLFLVFTLLTAFISAIICTLYITSEIHEKRGNIREQVQLLTRQLAESARLPLYAENLVALQQLAETALSAPEMRSVAITTHDGRVLLEIALPGRSASPDDFSETAEVRSNPMSDSVESAFTGTRNPAGVLIGTVRLERGADDLLSSIRRTVALSCSMALGFWLVVSLICHLVLRRVTSSFNKLMRGVKVLQKGDYSTRIDVTTEDEPGRAAVAINVLAEALQQREAENSRLTAQLYEAVKKETLANESLASLNRSLESEVSERIRTEQMARQSELTLRSLMDVMPVGVVWTDQNNSVEYTNCFFNEFFGYGRDEIITLSDWFMFAFPDPLYREQVIEAHQSVLRSTIEATRETPHYEARVTCKDEAVRHVLIKNQISQERRIMILIDITDRDLLQEQLIKAQKLESLGVLAGGIAHNFNNVLTGVMGYISFAHKFIDESHKAFMPLQKAEDASRRAAGMARQLLTFARGGDPIKMPVSVSKIIEESLSLALNGTSVKGVAEIPSSLHTVMADEGQLSQVFNNIIINAVQSMPRGGTLTVCAENVQQYSTSSACHQQMPHVRISFRDEGCGIPEENLMKIFDPYFTTKSVGTGLGLASAHSIVTKHGGQIFAESLGGKGATFSIVLPATGIPDVQIAESENKSACSLQGSGAILIMDDEEMIREFVRNSLESLGYAVTTCINGDEAVARYANAYESGKPFAAVILDLTVQHGMGGQDAAQHILACDPQAILIVSSGYSFNPVMAGFESFGFKAAVTKPYKVDELASQLGLLLGSSSESPHVKSHTSV